MEELFGGQATGRAGALKPAEGSAVEGSETLIEELSEGGETGGIQWRFWWVSL